MVERNRCSRRLLALMGLILGAGLMVAPLQTQAATSGKIQKVLAHFLDKQGRHAVSPSLYERDAYQYFLRKNPAERSGMAYDVRWKSSDSNEPMRLRLEIRGVKDRNVKLLQRETSVKKKGWFSSWNRIELSGDDYKAIDEITAWRVTLWSGETMLDEEKSFLW